MNLPAYRQPFTYWLWMLTAFLFLLPASLSGQPRIVSGTVVNEEKTPLEGVAVTVKGTQRGVFTNAEGRFSIEASESETLTFAYLGFKTKEIKVAGQLEIKVVLEQLAICDLDHIVSIGYALRGQRQVTGALVSVYDHALTDVKSHNVLEALQGIVPGVDITREDGRTGADIDLLIRGQRSLMASHAPLVLLDGVPYGNDIDLNPEDIESIEFLKDAALTAIYGVRGANGVVLIRSKTGLVSAPQVSFHTYYGVTKALQNLPNYDREAYIRAKTDAHRTLNDWNKEPDLPNVFLGNELSGFEAGTDTDWQDLVTQPGNQQDYHLNISGASQRISYHSSLDYYQEKGVVKSDKLDRFVYRLNLNAQATDWLTVGGSTVLRYRKRTGRAPDLMSAMSTSPIVPASGSSGTYVLRPHSANPMLSPLARLEDEQESRETRLFTTAFAQARISDNLIFRTSANADIRFDRLGYLYPQKGPGTGLSTSGAQFAFGTNFLWNNVLTYHRSAGKHEFEAIAGHEMLSSRLEFYSIEGQGQEFEQTLWFNLGTNQLQQTASGLNEWALSSFFGRIHYRFDHRFLVDVTGRYDGNSILAPTNKWTLYPAASVGWRISEEDFARPANWLNDLKLRAGYGVAGNAGFPALIQVGWPSQPVVPVNTDLQSERSRQANVGLDLAILNYRVGASLDLFQISSDNLLVPVFLPPASQDFLHSAATKTRGWEFLLQTLNIHQQHIEWRSNLSLFAVREEIVALASGITADEGNNWFVGEPIQAHYDFEKIGIWQLGEETDPLFNGPGEIKVRDQNDDGRISFDDRTVLGSAQPTWSGSLINQLEVARFDVTLNFFARWGQMVFAEAYAFDPQMAGNMMAVDYWTPENPTDDYPRYDVSRREIPFQQTVQYVDGSFIKVKNITIGYSFPFTLLERWHLQTLRLYTSARNPFILYSALAPGLDPELSGRVAIPLPRLWLFGLDITMN